MQPLVRDDETFPALYSTEDIPFPDKVVVAKFRAKFGWNWYMVEYDPITREGFGLVKGWASEWGYFSISELEDMNEDSPTVFRVEDFEPVKASVLLNTK